MKRFPLFLMLALLLCGCAPQQLPIDATQPAPTETAPANLISGSRAEGALRTYLLEKPLKGFLPLGEGLVLFSGGEMALLDTRSMTVAARAPGDLEQVQRLEQGLAWFDGVQTVVLDDNLRELRRIPAPADLTGAPLLSADGQTLFYCTPSAVRALDLTGGISRILKEAAYPGQTVTGLLLNDTVLQVSITDGGQEKDMFLSSETGQLLKDADGRLSLETAGDFYFLHTDGTMLFGHGDGPVSALAPLRYDGDCLFLPDSRRALIPTGAGTLDLYDLETGMRRAELILPEAHSICSAAETPDGRIWFLCEGEAALHCWEPAASEVSDDRYYLEAFYTRQEPDYDGLAVCALQAQALSEACGINILIYKDAAAVEPWDYRLDYEHQAGVLRRELEALDERLGQLPPGFLETLAGKFTSINICLVRSVRGSPASGSQEPVNGIQFLSDFDAYIVLATDHDTRYALWHELSHLMETVVLTESVAYDRWDNLNPREFRYGSDHGDGNPWMEPGKEYFIDTYAMSAAREDRARLFEYAMTPGHEARFTSPNLQRKLRQLCIGIREGFALENWADPLPWEQYLTEPLCQG